MTTPGPLSKDEWLRYLRKATAESEFGKIGVIYGTGVKNMRVRFWPPGIVYDKPPESLHGQY
jgi:hypothetical protein